VRIQIIRTDGTEETITAAKSEAYAKIKTAIRAQLCDTVNLRDGRVMFVDDEGYQTKTLNHGTGRFELRPVRAKKPVNEKATKIYWSVCKPGTTHKIVGDVAIANDSDFE